MYRYSFKVLIKLTLAVIDPIYIRNEKIPNSLLCLWRLLQTQVPNPLHARWFGGDREPLAPSRVDHRSLPPRIAPVVRRRRTRRRAQRRAVVVTMPQMHLPRHLLHDGLHGRFEPFQLGPQSHNEVVLGVQVQPELHNEIVLRGQVHPKSADQCVALDQFFCASL